MDLETENKAAPLDRAPQEPAKRLSRRDRFFRTFRQVLLSSLTRRILFLNLVALAVLLSGILYLNTFRDGLVNAYENSLVIQGRIIASAISSSATFESDAITIDPDKLLELEAGESLKPSINSLDSLATAIDPERVAPLLKRLIQPGTRARIYDSDGVLILDTRFLYSGGQVRRYTLPSITDQTEDEDKPEFFSSKSLGNFLKTIFRDRSLEIYKEHPNTGLKYPEVVSALTGANATIDRISQSGEQIISVAVPIQRFRVVSGALLLSTEGDVIDNVITEERLSILRIFLVAFCVLIVLSVLLAGTIATPLRRLSEAANRVRRGINSREEIPDFSNRQDEIGTLSSSLREMTNSLYMRIEAIESFAADVSHELKNPLTSLRSAVETLPLAKTEESKEKLNAVIQHDVKRLDRLITDISDASRLDAELARDTATQIDFNLLVQNIVGMVVDQKGDKSKIKITLENSNDKKPLMIFGHEDRLAQVTINLIENAYSFVPKNNGQINISVERQQKEAVLSITDNGPGIPAENIERVFERFYTDRPVSDETNAGFGQNSGLGLSISQQIIEAHGGTIIAENISSPKDNIIKGAKFVVRIPLETKKVLKKK
ncbi:MAG: stimulus-sensing domain-containing protein [Nitratireductor sp.]